MSSLSRSNTRVLFCCEYKWPEKRVNRVVLEQKLGRPMRPGYYALHTCDYKSCVNPDHLYEGTPADNMQDLVLRNPDSVEHLKRIGKTGRAIIKKKYQEDPEFRAKMQANLVKGTEDHRTKYQNDPIFRAKVQAILAKGPEARRREKDK